MPLNSAAAILLLIIKSGYDNIIIAGYLIVYDTSIKCIIFTAWDVLGDAVLCYFKTTTYLLCAINSALYLKHSVV